MRRKAIPEKEERRKERKKERKKARQREKEDVAGVGGMGKKERRE